MTLTTYRPWQEKWIVPAIWVGLFLLLFMPLVIKHDVWGQEHPTPRWPRWEDLPPRGCWENLTEAFKPWNISQWDIPSPINLFQNMRIDGETGRMWYDHKKLDEGEEDAVVEMRAEMDLLVAAANDVDGVEPFHIQVYDEPASSL